MGARPGTKVRVTACPRCGAADIARIQYGYPAGSAQLDEDLQAKRVVLGGCLVWTGMPDRHCTACGLEFRSDGEPLVEPRPW